MRAKNEVVLAVELSIYTLMILSFSSGRPEKTADPDQGVNCLQFLQLSSEELLYGRVSLIEFLKE